MRSGAPLKLYLKDSRCLPKEKNHKVMTYFREIEQCVQTPLMVKTVLVPKAGSLFPNYGGIILVIRSRHYLC